MTVKLAFEATLIELSKVQAPALKLYEFNYLFNKAINLYINKVYNTYDLNQQTTDDLRVLKATAYLTPKKWNKDNSALHNYTGNASSYLSRAHRSIQSLHGATYEVAMPIDYLHLLNCVCVYYVAKQKDCWDAGSYIEIPATRLTADSWSLIVSDVYNRPSPMKPYYYIHNQNNATSDNIPTDPITAIDPKTGMPNGTDLGGLYKVTSNGSVALEASTDGVDTGYTDSYNVAAGAKVEIKLYTATEAAGLENTNKAHHNGNTVLDTTKSIALGLDGDYYTDALGAANLTAEKKLSVEIKDPKFYTLEYIGSSMQVCSAGYNVSGESYTNLAIGGNAGSNFPRTFKLDFTPGIPGGETEVSLVEKPIGLRAGNTSNVRMEIRYGKDDTLFLLKEVQVDYVKAPQYIRLTLEQMDLSEDTSQIMEFPDYVNQEIVNELVHLVMERLNDPRLSNNILMTNTIARPTGQLAQPQALARG